MSLAKKSWKKAIALFLAVVMALSFVPNITAFAAGDNTTFEVTALDGVAGYTDVGTGQAADDRAIYRLDVANGITSISPNFAISGGATRANIAAAKANGWSISGRLSTSNVGTHEIIVAAPANATTGAPLDGTASGQANFYYEVKADNTTRVGLAIEPTSLKYGTISDEAANTAEQRNFTYGVNLDKFAPAMATIADMAEDDAKTDANENYPGEIVGDQLTAAEAEDYNAWAASVNGSYNANKVKFYYVSFKLQYTKMVVNATFVNYLLH